MKVCIILNRNIMKQHDLIADDQVIPEFVKNEDTVLRPVSWIWKENSWWFSTEEDVRRYYKDFKPSTREEYDHATT